MTAIETLLARNAERRLHIAVIGDVLIDDYRECACERISQEGPHPILRELTSLRVPGGAGNTARQLHPWNVDVSLIPAAVWSAPIKKRYCVGGKVVIRVDDERSGVCEIKSACEALFVNPPDAVVISDYGKGMINECLAIRLVGLCKGMKVPIIVDSKNHRLWWRNCTVFQVDLLRANAQAAWQIRDELDSDFVVLTCGPLPPIVASASKSDLGVVQQGPMVDVDAVSVSGAGDHFAAILTLALAHGFPIYEAASLAHESGCVYVTRRYNEPVLPHELHTRFDPVSAKIKTAEEIRGILDWKKPNKIVFTNGVFDVLHAGHLATLEFAKRQGEILVVAVNSDESAIRVKNKKPVVPDWQRARVLAGLSCVDFVVVFDLNTPENVMKIIRPRILVKGPDNYLNPNIPGKDLVEEVRFAPQTKAILHSTEMLESYKNA